MGEGGVQVPLGSQLQALGPHGDCVLREGVTHLVEPSPRNLCTLTLTILGFTGIGELHIRRRWRFEGRGQHLQQVDALGASFYARAAFSRRAIRAH